MLPCDGSCSEQPGEEYYRFCESGYAVRAPTITWAVSSLILIGNDIWNLPAAVLVHALHLSWCRGSQTRLLQSYTAIGVLKIALLHRYRFPQRYKCWINHLSGIG